VPHALIAKPRHRPELGSLTRVLAMTPPQRRPLNPQISNFSELAGK